MLIVIQCIHVVYFHIIAIERIFMLFILILPFSPFVIL